MPRVLLFITVIIGLYLFLNPPVSVIADVPPFPQQVEVVVKPGVTAYEVQAVKRSLSLAAKVLSEEARLPLKHPVTVILTPDITSYYQVLMTEELIDSDSALYQASVSAGTTKESHIVLNCGAVPNYNDLIFIAAHELTHQYQFETEGDWSRNNWFIEGMAEVIAATVVGINQGNRAGLVADYRHNWTMQLRKAAPKIPGLQQLDKRREWFEAFNQYHTLPYRYGALAVFNLADERGLPALGQYIRLRNQGMSAEAAFQQVFNKTLPVFFQNQDRWLKEKIDEKHYQLKAYWFITPMRLFANIGQKMSVQVQCLYTKSLGKLENAKYDRNGGHKYASGCLGTAA